MLAKSVTWASTLSGGLVEVTLVLAPAGGVVDTGRLPSLVVTVFVDAAAVVPLWATVVVIGTPHSSNAGDLVGGRVTDGSLHTCHRTHAHTRARIKTKQH